MTDLTEPATEHLTDIWRRTLRAETDAAADSDFLSLGGDQAEALAIAAEIRAAYGVEVSLREFFARPTLERLTELILAAPARPATAAAPTRPAALTDLQQAYWLGRHAAFELGGAGAHRYLEIEVDDLDLPRLAAAWRRLIERHEALRMIVTGDGGRRVLSDVPGADIRIDARPGEQIRAEMLSRAFQPDRWPLFDLRTSRVDERRTRLHVAVDLLVGDADSVAILGAELARLYRDGPASAKPSAVSPAQRRSERSPDDLAGRSRTYWRHRVPALPPAPQLPLPRDPKTFERPVPVRCRCHLPAETWRQVGERGRAAGMTRSAVLLAAFAETVAAWSTAPHYTLAVTGTDRPHQPDGAEPAVGDFTTLTLVDVDADPNTSFTDHAAAIQQRLWEALDHRHSPAIETIRDLARAAGQPLTAPAPVVFSSRLGPGRPAIPAAAWRLGDSRLVHDVDQVPQVWLHHDVAEDDTGGLVITWDTVDGLFPAGMFDDLADAHLALLRRLAETPGVWTEPGYDMVPAHQQQVRDQVNDTAAPLPSVLLHELFWDQARRTPDAAAIIAAQRTLTYRELRAGATALADQLRGLGTGPNRLVAIVMDKGWEQPLAVLGIHNAGAAYVPIEPDLPEERFHYLLSHSEVTTAVVQPHLADALPWPDGVRRVVVDETLLGGDGALEPRLDQGQDDLAYVIYTSGSTGLPKGVMVSHRGALNTCLDINRRFGVGPADRMLALTPLSFDLSVYDLFGLWAVGGALVMPDAGSGRAPWHWADLMERHQVTLWNTVPALMEMLVDYTAGRRQRIVDSLRLVLMSGDWIPVPLPDRIRAAAAPGIELISLGGATEASIWSIYHRIGEVDPAWPSIPYGKPLANQWFEILDNGLRRRPDWVPGDQYVGGTSVALGYWRDEEKTRRAFITHPRTGRRMYRMGDLGRYFPDGTMQFLGRQDFQVKIHGYRVELGEIETAMLSHDDVAAAVVTAIGKAQGEKRLIGYITTAVADHDVLVKSLREHLAAKLPAYMVPTHILVLDSIPLTRNGKVDRKALPLPKTKPAATDGRPPTPASDIEIRLAAIWHDLFSSGSIDVTADYTELGATSLTIAQAHHRITASLAPDLSLDTMFRHRTIRALAEHLAQT
jgi:amino acid adenylation domain-containing protein